MAIDALFRVVVVDSQLYAESNAGITDPLFNSKMISNVMYAQFVFIDQWLCVQS